MSRAKKKAVPVSESAQNNYTTPYQKSELLPFGDGMKLLRLDIPMTIEFALVLTELCKIKEWDLKRYV